jgi:hypothetical protein
MRLLPIIITATALGVMDASMEIHPHFTPVPSLSELDPAIKVLAHYIADNEWVVLVRPDQSLLILMRNGDKYVESKEADLEESSTILKHELDVGKLVLMPLTGHLVLKTDTSGGLLLGDKKFATAKDALNDERCGALINPLLRVEPLKGMSEWKDKGLVVFHFQQSWSKETVIMQSKDGSIFSLFRGPNGMFIQSTQDGKLMEHLILEIASKRIVTQEVGLHTIVMRIGDEGYYVLSHDGARFVPALSELQDHFLGPRLGLDARMKCHSVPIVDKLGQDFLIAEYDLVAYFIINDSGKAQQLVVIKKKVDESIAILWSPKGDMSTPFTLIDLTHSTTSDLRESLLLNAKALVESSDFIAQPWEDHTVYEWLEIHKSFAIHTLSEPRASIKTVWSDIPAIRLIVPVLGLNTKMSV